MSIFIQENPIFYASVADFNGPAESILNFAALDTVKGIVKFLCGFSDFAFVDGDFFIFPTHGTDGGDNSGGAGTEEVVAGADWSKLPKRPELYLQGYSAVTSILCALDGKGYGRPVAGPNVSSLGALDPGMIPLMKKMYNGEEVGPFKLTTLVSGDCSGKALAGTLSRFNKVAKTDYNVNIKGRIVFMESVFCKADKFRAELTELCNSKFLDGAAGIVFCHLTRGDKLEVLMPVLKEFAPKFNVPVYLGFPYGHHPKNLAIDFSRNVVITNGVLTFPAVKK